MAQSGSVSVLGTECHVFKSHFSVIFSFSLIKIKNDSFFN